MEVATIAEATEAGLTGALSAVDDCLAPALATEEARQRVRRAAAAIPPVSGLGLECHLGDPDRVDLAVRWRRHERAASGAPWDAVAWRCFDGNAPSGAYLGPGANATERCTRDELDDWLAGLDALTHEQGARVPATAHPTLAALFERLGEEERVTYLGFLPGRDAEAVRVVIGGVPADGLPACLDRLGWPGDVGEISDRLAPALMVSAPPVVQLEVGEAVRDPLGVELRPLSRDWEALLATMLPLDLRDLRAAILGWAGSERLDERWPWELRTRWDGAVRRINHLKWSFRPGSDPLLKAYLYLGLISDSQSGPAEDSHA